MPFEKLGEVGDNLGLGLTKFIGPVILRDTMQLEEGASILSANFASGSLGFKFAADGTGELYGDFSVGGDISLDGGTIYTELDRTSSEYLAIGDPYGTGTENRIHWFNGSAERGFISVATTGSIGIMTLNAAADHATLGVTDTVMEIAGGDSGSGWGKGYADLYVGLYNKSSVVFWKNNDGLASTPSYTFGSDTNTGIYRIGSDQLGFSTGGTLRLSLSTTTLALTGAMTVSSSLTVSGSTFLQSATTSRTIAPASDNSFNLGSASSYRYANVYMVGGSGAAATDININTSTGQLFQVTSSRRYKKNIRPYRDGLDMLLALRPVNFQWKKGKSDAGYDDSFLDLGLIAEEVAEVAPEFVVFNKDGEPESVRYSSLVMPLINAVRELADEVDRLSAMID